MQVEPTKICVNLPDLLITNVVAAARDVSPLSPVKPKLPRIRDIAFSPNVNPLVDPKAITVRQKHVRTGIRHELTNAETGEIVGASMIHTIEEKDDAEFVKVFAAGIKAIYELGSTASRVFQVVLDVYQNEPMNGGFADSLYLAWFGDGLSGQPVGMSEATFNRGLRELISKRFLAPRSPNLYWVNPALFFKGDRVLFMREFVRKRSDADAQQRLR